MIRKWPRRRIRVKASSGSVLSDLGIPHARELDTKALLAVEINRLVEARRLSRVEAAARLKIGQRKVSALKHYKLDSFSVGHLMHFLLALGRDIEIRARKANGPTGRIVVRRCG
jgi:predicted XRE-type DNA-binding protein